MLKMPIFWRLHKFLLFRTVFANKSTAFSLFPIDSHSNFSLPNPSLRTTATARLTTFENLFISICKYAGSTLYTDLSVVWPHVPRNNLIFTEIFPSSCYTFPFLFLLRYISHRFNFLVVVSTAISSFAGHSCMFMSRTFYSCIVLAAQFLSHFIFFYDRANPIIHDDKKLDDEYTPLDGWQRSLTICCATCDQPSSAGNL